MIINEYVISGYKEAAREKLRANLSLSTYWKDKDTLRLVVRNDGPSDAFNVMVVGMDRDCYLFRDSAASAPIETLYSGDSEEFDLQVYSDMPQKTRVQVNWIDDSKEMRTKKVILSIH